MTRLSAISNIGMATAFAAGVVSFLSPCVLPLVPGYVSYVSGSTLGEIDRSAGRRLSTLFLSVCFVLGFSTVFIALGATATAVSRLLLQYRYEANIAGGAIVILFGVFMTGLIPMPLWESDCTKRLEVIRDIPAGKCIYWFERTDMVKAFEVLGDVVALRGNLSPSLLTTGKPEEVDAAVRHLAENVFHKGGKLILDAAFGLPDETPVENVRAMYAAARKYTS